MIRDMLVAIESWMFDDDSMILVLLKISIVFGVPIALIVAFFVHIGYTRRERDIQNCINAGGAWRIVGQHEETIYIMVGKVMVPSREREVVTDYGCTKP